MAKDIYLVVEKNILNEKINPNLFETYEEAQNYASKLNDSIDLLAKEYAKCCFCAKNNYRNKCDKYLEKAKIKGYGSSRCVNELDETLNFRYYVKKLERS